MPAGDQADAHTRARTRERREEAERLGSQTGAPAMYIEARHAQVGHAADGNRAPRTYYTW